MEKYEIAGERWAKASDELRNTCTEYLLTILNKNNNHIEWENSQLNEFTTVSYDGGNHPEYASNVFSTVYGIDYKNKRIYLQTEDTTDYDISSIYVGELYDLCCFIDCHKEDIGIK